MKKILMFLSLIGFADAFYLSIPYFSKVEMTCNLGNINTCDIVTTSEYARTFFNIPNAFLGTLFFISLFLVFTFWKKVKDKIIEIEKIIIGILLSAILFFIYLIYIQTFIIGEYCLYCLFSAFITFLIFILSVRDYIKR